MSYPEVIRQFFKTRIGKKFKPIVRKVYKRIVRREKNSIEIVKTGIQVGRNFKPELPTAIVVSHEASTTGAPILALNICQEISYSYNVVAILLGNGPLITKFLESGVTSIIRVDQSLIEDGTLPELLDKASYGNKIEFALVNTAVAACMLAPLRSRGIACLSLIHEFPSYIKPLSTLIDIGLWSTRIICSTSLMRDEILNYCPIISEASLEVLPQGSCKVPIGSQLENTTLNIDELLFKGHDTEHFLARLPTDTLLVIGAGYVQPRKGVDLFISVAHQIYQMAPELNIQFAWIGGGYDPEQDFTVSVWIKDQIERSGLQGKVVMLNESVIYTKLMDRSDLFLMTSRLDPLPNVAIDAMQKSTPVLCFAKACGISSLLEQNSELYESCVAPYLDCNHMAKQAVEILKSPTKKSHLGQVTFRQSKIWFDMPSYIRQLLQFAQTSAKEVRQEDDEIDILIRNNLIQASFFCPNQKLSSLLTAQRYLLAWRKRITPRKPFPGFHPGIYRELNLTSDSQQDPLVDWFKHGKPNGPWSVKLIQPETLSYKDLPRPNKVALHIHVYYPDLLPSMLERIACNHTQPDLFISYSIPEIELSIKEILKNYKSKVNFYLVPNRGRDIGPLLSLIGRILDREYTFYGHIHTKKSQNKHVHHDVGVQWREFLLTNLLGKKGTPMLDNIMTTLQSEQHLGLIFPDDPNCVGWTKNSIYANELATRLNLQQLPKAINFPIGTMFWARQGALSKLYRLGLTWEDYPEEPIRYDGTILHALERLLPQVCTSSGYSYAMTYVPGWSR